MWDFEEFLQQHERGHYKKYYLAFSGKTSTNRTRK